MHPTYQGKLLTTDQREVANNWLLQKNPESIESLLRGFSLHLDRFTAKYAIGLGWRKQLS